MNRRMRKQRYIWLSLFAAAAAAAILCIALLSTGQGSMSTRRLLQNVKNLTRERTTTTEFWYNNAEGAVFAPVGGGFLIGSRDSIRCLDSSGNETVLAAVELSSPAADFSEDLALIYDLGGKYLCVADRQGIIWSGEAEGNIFSASINGSGWIAVCSEAEIMEFCMELPRYKRPRKIFFDKVPRNPTGKIEKPALREKYCHGRLVEVQITG